MRYAEIKGITIYNGCYLCPEEEYEAILAEERLNPVSPDRYARSNALYFSDRDIERTDPILVQVVEELGDKANGMCAELRITEVRAGTRYRIDEYDGNESVMTQDSYKWSVA
jgi:hypothetical protein